MLSGQFGSWSERGLVTQTHLHGPRSPARGRDDKFAHSTKSVWPCKHVNHPHCDWFIIDTHTRTLVPIGRFWRTCATAKVLARTTPATCLPASVKMRLVLLLLYLIAHFSRAREPQSYYGGPQSQSIGYIPGYLDAQPPPLQVYEGDLSTGSMPSSISLAIVFDSTGSMGDDLKQVKLGARRILQRHLEKGREALIKDFVLVKVHDPGEFAPKDHFCE